MLLSGWGRSLVVRSISTMVLLAALAGCATDVANRYYGSEHYPPRPTDSVQVLSAAPDRPYDVIADFQSRGDSPKSLRAKAAAIGADAILITDIGGYSASWEESANQSSYHSGEFHIIGTAIKYKE